MGVHMKIFYAISIIALLSVTFLTGCGSEGSKSTPTIAVIEEPAAPPANTSSKTSENPIRRKIVVPAGCEDITDEADIAKMFTIKENVTDIYAAFGDKNLNYIQALSTPTKASARAMLAKYPQSCEAQLAFVATIISEIANNEKINNILDIIYGRQGKSKSSILSTRLDDFEDNMLIVSVNSTDDLRNITASDIQSALESVIPSVDSAIAYMTNIANDDSFTSNYTIKKRVTELDRGEFAGILAILYFVDAYLIFLVSINADIDINGSYSWIDSLQNWEYDYTTNVGGKQLIKLFDKSSKVSSVYDNWKDDYRDIPNLMDSVYHYEISALQYGLQEAKNGLATQANDLYIVGDDEMADISTSDVRTAIDTLYKIKKTLREGLPDTINDNVIVKYNFYNFFQITDGFQQFLPYHKINDTSIWDTPDGGFEWTEALIDDKSYAQRFIEKKIAEALRKLAPKASDIDISSHFDGTSSGYARARSDSPYLSFRIEFTTSLCNVEFSVTSSNSESLSNWKIPNATIPKGMCKVENGKAKYATAFEENSTPNILYFTDAKGKKTISLQELVNNSYENSELRNYLIFPDVTFGGVLMDMTLDRFWNEYVPALQED